ncbi:hypothetical protein [Amycolatopsis pigmentata]|uniref:DUF1524 domain-containing protein n=1 Tax=Amycolatopsis pigmentata TaxID=450801 RepID=A0ABW5FTY2_9PSEU
MNRLTIAATAAALLALTTTSACKPPDPGKAAAGTSTAVATAGSLPAGNPNAPMPAPGTCKVGSRDGQPMPDPACTPGAINPDVTQANIDSTICKSGWTKTVRPPTSRTGRMKTESARSYGIGADEKGEYDHLVSLELGGAPDDPRNLWVEPGSIPNAKDAVENKLNDAVCSDLVSLAQAQKAIASNWVTAIDDVGLRVAGGKLCLRADPSKCVTKGGDKTGE